MKTLSCFEEAMLANPLQMNDWEISATLKIALTSYLITWASIGLDAIGLHVPLLRGFFGTVALLFVPGILLLRVLRAHHLGSTRTLLFAVGLSAATIMFTGLFMNVIYPLLGVARPFDLIPAVGTMTAVTAVLAATSYWRDRGFADDAVAPQSVLTPPALVLCLLPFAMIFASYVSNNYHSNIALLAVLVVVGATAFWVAASLSFPKQWYPLAVFAIALAMLYYGSLVSSYVWGWDIQKELFHANLVLTNGAWSTALSGPTNAVMSVTVLAPLLSLTTGVSVTWLFKLVYPLLFALVPLGLFVVVQKQTNDKVAFLSAFFVSLLYTFYGEMPSLARQEIAELFLILLLILMVDKYHSTGEGKRVYALYTVFSASLVVSHYALALVYLIYLVIAWLLLFLIDNPALRRLKRLGARASHGGSPTPRRMVTLGYVLSFAALTGVWYVSVGAAASKSIELEFNQILYAIFTPHAIAIVVAVGAVVYVIVLALVYLIKARRQETAAWQRLHGAAPVVFFAALSMIGARFCGASLNDVLQIGTLSPLHEVGRALYLLSVALIAMGLLTLARRHRRMEFDVEYVALALASFAILIGAVTVPQLTFSINTTRLFHISTLFLAPFCVTGGLFIAQSVARVTMGRQETVRAPFTLKLVAALFVVLFLFNTGFVYEVAHQESVSFILDSSIDAARYNGREVAAGQWLHDVRSGDSSALALPIYADAHRRVLLDSFDFYPPTSELSTSAPAESFVYLGTYNIERGQIALVQTMAFLQGTVISYAPLGNVTDARSKIFDDGGAAIYYQRATFFDDGGAAIYYQRAT